MASRTVNTAHGHTGKLTTLSATPSAGAFLITHSATPSKASTERCRFGQSPDVFPSPAVDAALHLHSRAMPQSLTSRGDLAAYTTRPLTQGRKWEKGDIHRQTPSAVPPGGAPGKKSTPARAGAGTRGGPLPPDRAAPRSPRVTVFPTDRLRVPPHGPGPGGSSAPTGRGEPRRRPWTGPDRTVPCRAVPGLPAPGSPPPPSGAERSRRGRTALPTAALAGRREERVTSRRGGEGRAGGAINRGEERGGGSTR